MEIRHFTVPFGRILEDSPELNFGPDDYCVIRPIFSRPATDIRSLAGRIGEVTDETDDSVVDRLIIDLLDQCILTWSLTGPDGPIAKPATPDALNALPGVLRGALFSFLTSYRGEGPNPTKGS